MLMAFIYKKLIHTEIYKKCFKIKNFSFFLNFVLKLEAFQLIHDSLIHFPVLFPVQNICIKFQYASLNVSKVIAWRKLQKSLWECKISRFLIFSTLLFWKIKFFPSKNHLAFLTIERYDKELTNIKISGKNIVPLGGAQAPEGVSFLPLFWNFADFGVKC